MSVCVWNEVVLSWRRYIRFNKNKDLMLLFLFSTFIFYAFMQIFLKVFATCWLSLKFPLFTFWCCRHKKNGFAIKMHSKNLKVRKSFKNSLVLIVVGRQFRRDMKKNLESQKGRKSRRESEPQVHLESKSTSRSFRQDFPFYSKCKQIILEST